MALAIKIEGLSKQYRLGVVNRDMLYKELESWWARWRGKEDPHSKIGEDAQNGGGAFWALKDINLEVEQGDCLGIIGRNGSGKSTLLKILTRITAPTEGKAILRGKVSSLLEVGTGFHPELTGRENIYLNGAILGMTRREVTSKFDEIVDFAGTEKFIDTPVKRYSSGMRVRLAFAVAAHLDPDIMIVDEVLAVGDAAFQQKCIGKMSEVARGGRTVLFVSHQMAAVQNLCRTGIVLASGQIVYRGDQIGAINTYIEANDPDLVDLRDRTDRIGSGRLRVTSIEFEDGEGRRTNSFPAGGAWRIRLNFENPSGESFPELTCSIYVNTLMDVCAFNQQSRIAGGSIGNVGSHGSIVCEIPELPLPEAAYRITFAVSSRPRAGEILDYVAGAASFEVSGGDFFGTGMMPESQHGACLVRSKWSVEYRIG